LDYGAMKLPTFAELRAFCTQFLKYFLTMFFFLNLLLRLKDKKFCYSDF